MSILTYNFESEYLKNNHEVTVILPDKPRALTPEEFYRSGRKYKVLWLLHGTFGDHSDWIRKSNIELYACENDLIVVMPSALNSDYLDWPGFGTGYQGWEYLEKELMPLVHHWLPASPRREDNYIAGLSMGGMGAIQYAVGLPERFAAAAVLSWAPVNLRAQLAQGRLPDSPREANRIAAAGSVENYLNSAVNVWDRLPGSIREGDLPRLYFAMGKEDFLYENFQAFRQYAGEIGLDAVIEDFDGYTHEWRFWDYSIQKALTFFGLDTDSAGNPY